jgi:hypothetical protein
MTKPCPACGAPVPLSARHCPECGAPNPHRRSIAVIVTILVVMVPAIAIAIYAATQWEHPLIEATENRANPGMPSQTITASDDNFDWLALAMKTCDEKAASEPDALHFLVIPIAHSTEVVNQWRRAALNRIGNALVLPGDQMLAALRKKTLTLSTEPYVFSIRDDQTGTVRKWDEATGVKWVSVEDAKDVSTFKMQYRPRGLGKEDIWGNGFLHRKGNCYWVNVLYEE